ncbi:hypothetical protein SEA_CECE_46 [Microbacterium phage Cece]|nr:hypothetical protein SEA_CECE_46 [Microbacterium phage Cece]
MARVWKCVNCKGMTLDPKEAGDHERKFYGRLLRGPYDKEFWSEGDDLLHYMDDIGE